MITEEQVVTLCRWLMNYGHHQRWCNYHDGGDEGECNCRFVEALVSARAWRTSASQSIDAAIAHHALTGE